MMKLTLQPTVTIYTVQGKVQARIWEGQTESGVPVKAWIALVQPQTHDAVMLAEFERELKEVPAKGQLASFDMRLL